MLNVVKYVWNDAKPSIDQIEKKQIKISITEPHEFLKGMLHVCSNIVENQHQIIKLYDIQIFKSLQNFTIVLLREQHQMRHRARDQVDAEQW